MMHIRSRAPWQRRLAFCAVAAGIAGATTASIAADLGGAPPPRYYEDRAPLEIERWTGFYLGAVGGYGFGDGRSRGDFGRFTFDQGGGVASLIAGYNWQVGRAVLGFETDVGTGGVSSRTSTPFGVVSTDLNAMGSFRARAGVLLTPALLVYGTAGVGWANMDIGLAGTDTRTQTFTGLQTGVGAELKISRNVGLRLEYLRTDFDRQTLDHAGWAQSYRPDTNTVRAGLTFRF